MGSIDKACISGFLCRLCSEMHRTVIHIYGEQGKKHGLVEKINGYLPITVSPHDPLPKTICETCLRRVEQHYELLSRLEEYRESKSMKKSMGVLRPRVLRLRTANDSTMASSSSSTITGTRSSSTMMAAAFVTTTGESSTSTTAMVTIAGGSSTSTTAMVISNDNNETLSLINSPSTSSMSSVTCLLTSTHRCPRIDRENDTDGSSTSQHMTDTMSAVITNPHSHSSNTLDSLALLLGPDDEDEHEYNEENEGENDDDHDVVMDDDSLNRKREKQKKT